MTHEISEGSRPANRNILYNLATIFDNESKDGSILRSTRTTWNRWAAAALTEDQRASLVTTGFPPEEIAPLSPEEKTDICFSLAQLCQRDSVSLPDPVNDIDLSSTILERTLLFDGFIFPRHLNFSSTQFENNIHFVRTHFFGSVDFSGAIFLRSADFSNSVFHDHANFSRSAFRSSVKFDGADFCGLTQRFTSVSFDGEASFSSVRFGTPSRSDRGRSASSLQSAEMITSFNRTHFRNNAQFTNTQFHSRSYIRAAEFCALADFSDCRFHQDVFFSKSKFCSKTEYETTYFDGNASFINSCFEAPTSFKKARFLATPPDLRGATLHDLTKWDAVVWPHLDTKDLESHPSKYARLRVEMERTRQHGDEQRFYVLELRARRHLSSFLSEEQIFNTAYAVLSDYSSSIQRPILGLIALVSSFACLLYVVSLVF